MPFKEYQNLLKGLKERIRNVRTLAVLTANMQMIALYWEIGNSIDDLEKASGWGKKTVDKVASDLKMEFPDMKGIAPRSLRYMREFAKAYPDFPILQHRAAKLPTGENGEKPNTRQLILQHGAAKLESPTQHIAGLLPWGHHMVILDKAKLPDERLFYIQKTLENSWSRDVLRLQIEGQLYERKGKSISNFSITLPAIDSDLAQQTINNPLLFDFLQFEDEGYERNLELGLVKHMTKLLLELGRGFTYVGNQFKIKVEDDEFYTDLLFFNTELNCYVVFELKVGVFKPEYTGKLNFYVHAIDQQVKRAFHQRTIGVLVCKTPNKTLVRYSVDSAANPLAVTDFTQSKALSNELKNLMPTEDELEEQLEGEMEKLKGSSKNQRE